jgi:hypothetical protein
MEEPPAKPVDFTVESPLNAQVLKVGYSETGGPSRNGKGVHDPVREVLMAVARPRGRAIGLAVCPLKRSFGGPGAKRLSGDDFIDVHSVPEPVGVDDALLLALIAKEC